MAAVVNSHFATSKNRLLGIFSGHTHTDSILQPFESNGEFTNPLNCTQVVIKSPFYKEKDRKILGIAVDIAVWTPSKNKFSIVRIGDGQDRKIAIKSFLTL